MKQNTGNERDWMSFSKPTGPMERPQTASQQNVQLRNA
jgi:hypothetical protein